MKSIRKNLVSVLIIILLIGIAFFANRSKPKVYETGNRLVMGTVARITAVSDNSDVGKDELEKAFWELEKVNKLMSDYDGDSEIGRVNKYAFQKAVAVSDETFKVLQAAVSFSEKTGGAFDITVGPLVDLWREAQDSNSIPAERQLQEAKERVGYEKLVLDPDGNKVKFKVKGMRVDLGGIAKGYAIDRAVSVLKEEGFAGGMVDVGGDIKCFGMSSAGKKHWTIGIQDPGSGEGVEEGKLLMKLNLKDKAIATSGDYRRFVVVKGQKYSHIIDSSGGKGSNKLPSVSVIAEDAVTADALATAVSVKGGEKGLELIEGISGVEAILITNTGSIKKTSQFSKMNISN